MEQVQVSHWTAPDRYPADFAFLANLTGDAPGRRVLSFGCSTGDEPFVLATKYFRNGAVVATDIIPDVMGAAMARCAELANVQFCEAKEDALKGQGPYDIIFAMSVFCRWPDTQEMEDVSRLVSFASFARQTAFLATCLKPGGYLVMKNSNYSFLDTQTAREFDLVDAGHLDGCGFVTRFRPDGSRAPSGARDFIYQKHY